MFASTFYVMFFVLLFLFSFWTLEKRSNFRDLPLKSETLSLLSIARDNLVFLHKWFVKFPQYRNTSLFITGESYAGHYVPQLAYLILRFNKKHNMFNLKGIAVSSHLLQYIYTYAFVLIELETSYYAFVLF